MQTNDEECPPIGPGKKYKDLYDFAINHRFDDKHSAAEQTKEYIQQMIYQRIIEDIEKQLNASDI